MDTFARGLEVAHTIREDGVFKEFIDDRYASYEEGIGTDITNGETDLTTLADYAQENADVTIPSGRQENLERTLNEYIFER